MNYNVYFHIIFSYFSLFVKNYQKEKGQQHGQSHTKVEIL